MRSATCLFVLGALGVACSSSRDDEGAVQPVACIAGPEVLVAASDYVSSVVCGAPCCVPPAGVADLGADPALALSNGRAFYIARTGETGDVLFELDPRTGKPFAKLRGLSVFAPPGIPANPHDVAAAPDGTLFVPLYSAPRLAFMKDGAVTGSLDLSGYDDDRNPQADAVRIVGDKAYVTLERLDDTAGFASTRPSAMLVVDVATRTAERTIELEGRNPFGAMAELDGALFLAEPGSFDSAVDALAGVERFDTATSTTKLLVKETALGGSVAEVAVTRGCGVAIVAGPEEGVNPTSVVSFDPETGAVLGTIFEPTPGYDLQGLAWRGSTLYLGDRRASADGTWPIHVFERGAGCSLTLTSRTIPLPQRPVALRPTSETP